MSQPDTIHVANSPEAGAEACASAILATLRTTLESAKRATIALSGGTSPRLLFDALAQAQFDWSDVHFFWVDERCVSPVDPQSNFHLADQSLFGPAHISKYNIHRIHGEMPPAEGAARYVEDLRHEFSLKPGELPVFDIIHRGIGPDAHTASLFPGEPLIADRENIAAAVWVEKLRSHRVTLLPGVLLAARRTFILAVGTDKAEPLYHVLKGPLDYFQYPCQIAVRDTASPAEWFIDRDAAAQL